MPLPAAEYRLYVASSPPRRRNRLLTCCLNSTSPAHPGVFAFVTIGGQAAKVYNTSDDDYIECIVGQPFQVTFVDNRATSPGHSYEVTLWTDGV